MAGARQRWRHCGARRWVGHSSWDGWHACALDAPCWSGHKKELRRCLTPHALPPLLHPHPAPQVEKRQQEAAQHEQLLLRCRDLEAELLAAQVGRCCWVGRRGPGLCLDARLRLALLSCCPGNWQEA